MVRNPITRVMIDDAGALRPWKRICRGFFRIAGTNLTYTTPTMVVIMVHVV